MDENEYNEVELSPHEYRIETTRGTGNGGQKRNKTDSCVTIIHLATGLKVRRDSRSQYQNKADALAELTKRVNNFYRTGHDLIKIEDLRDQIGEGIRSDKRRTYNVKSGIVVDHITGKKARLKDIIKGKIELLS